MALKIKTAANLGTDTVHKMSASAKREETKAPGYFSVYANDVQLQTTPWDMRLTIGEFEVSKKTNPAEAFLNVQILGDIRMSPQLAKRLVVVMVEQLQQYEQRFGEIPVPKD